MDRLAVHHVLAFAALGFACGASGDRILGDGWEHTELQTQALTWPEGGFHPCRFNFGAAWQGTKYSYPAAANYTTLWLGDTANWNEFWEGEFLRFHWAGQPLAGKTPVFYSYIIAFTARRQSGLKDCDTGSPNLCEQGANFIRQNEATILAQYRKFASNTARIWGKTNPIIWLMEPDFYQYADGRQQGGGFSYQQMGTLMGKLLDAVRAELPNALFSMDISPWVADPERWFAALPMSRFAFVNTSGGRTDADSARIRNENNMRWQQVFQITGLRIIADDGYGVGGGSIGHDGSWDNVNNLRARMSDGVIGVTQANPRGDWSGIVSGVRGQLTSLPNCTAMTAPVMAMMPMMPAQGGQGGASSPAGGSQGGTQGQGGGGATVGSGGNASPQEPGDSEFENAGGNDGHGEPSQGQDDPMGPPPEDDEKLNEFFGVGCGVHGAPRPSGIGALGLALGCVWALARRRRRRGSA